MKMAKVLNSTTKRNIEIKARIADYEGYKERIEIAKKLTNTNGEILKQHDIFYKVPKGRLKLRMQVRRAFISNIFQYLNSFDFKSTITLVQQ